MIHFKFPTLSLTFAQKAVDMLLDNEDKISVSVLSLSAFHQRSDTPSSPADRFSSALTDRQGGGRAGRQTWAPAHGTSPDRITIAHRLASTTDSGSLLPAVPPWTLQAGPPQRPEIPREADWPLRRVWPSKSAAFPEGQHALPAGKGAILTKRPAAYSRKCETVCVVLHLASLRL